MVQTDFLRQKSDMKMPVDPALYRRLLIASAAAILLGTVAVAALTAWSPGEADAAELAAAGESSPAPAEGLARLRLKCAECGMVTSTRPAEELDGQASRPSDAGITRVAAGAATRSESGDDPAKASRRYEITVRMRDGSNRVFIDANPSNWRPGERVMFIEGAGRPKD